MSKGPLIGKYDLQGLKITKLAVVDRPAQSGASITHVAKRAVTDPPPAPEKTMPTIEELQADITKRDAVIKRLGLIVALTAVAKAHYDGLPTEEAKDAFLAKPAGEQATIAKRVADEDPVVAVVEGVSIRKSQDPTGVIVAMSKRADEDRARVVKAEQVAETARVEKRATEELPHLPGTVAQRGAIVKALEGITDEATRIAAFAALTAGDKALAEVTKRQGVGPDGKPTPGAGGPAEELEAVVKKYQADNKVDRANAYSEVLKTTEGKRLYDASLTTRN